MYSESKCFRMLGIGRHASLEEVRKAYRGLALNLHPDRPGGDEERFKEITAAYNLLVQRLNTGTGPRARKDGSRRGKVWSTSERRSDTPSNRNGASWQRWRPDSKSDLGSSRDPRFRGRGESAGSARRSSQSNQGRPKSDGARRASSAAGSKQERNRDPSKFKKARRQNWTTPTRKTTTAPPPSAEAEREMHEDLASAWKAWCATARSYQEEQQEEGHASSFDGQSVHRESSVEDITSRESVRGGFMGWFKRGLNKLKSQPVIRVSSHDQYLRLRVNETTLLYGGQHRIAIHRDEICPSCVGQSPIGCVCGGSGRVKVRDVVSVTVPPGARSGVQLRLEGKGTAGLTGESNGDLFLQLEPSEIRGFRREEIDLHGVFSVPASVAQQGGVVEVDLPRGEVKVHVPPGTRSGDKFRLRGLGVPAWQGHEIGDVYLSVMLN